MTLHQLRTFLAVVDAGSVQGAAAALVVSQPAVSAAVSALTREVGVDLLQRQGRGISITEAGRAFAAEVRTSLDGLDRATRVARSVEEPGQGTVRLAAIATAAEHLLLPLLVSFRDGHPEAGINVRVGNRATVWDALRGLDVDLVVAGRPPSSIDGLVLGRATNALVVVGPPPVPPSARAAMELLASSTWLLREEGSGTRAATDGLLASLDLDPPTMVLGSNGAVEAAVVGGFGVAVLPVGAIAPRLDDGSLVGIDCPGTPLDRPWHLVAPGAVTPTPTAVLAARSLLVSAGGFRPTPEGRRWLDR
ncbi:MAG: LysR family transcriptional regulator [Acidimicrobiales bacterium]